MLTLTGVEVPTELTRLDQPPKELYLEGNLQALLARPRLAVVGARKATPYGRGVTTKLVEELVRTGVVIISGLAYGIDSIAQRACVDAGGQTIAVLPAGLDDIYPAAHAGLARDIVAQGGVLLTEYPPHSIPYQSNFLARNRLIAALSDGILIPEAAARSGSLNTARHGLEQGKTVLAVPGNITSVLSGGTNNLIKAGAIPATEAADILSAMGWANAPKPSVPLGKTKEEQVILDLLASGISDGARLLAQSQLATPLFNQTLTMLEITGKIRPLGANHWAIA